MCNHLRFSKMAARYLFLSFFLVYLLAEKHLVVAQSRDVIFASASNCTSPATLTSGGDSAVVSSQNETGSGSGDEHSCMDINEALDSIESNSMILLEQGNHILRKSYNIYHLTNISLIGRAGVDGVSISCQENSGFAFVNITQLTLTNLTLNGCGLSSKSLQSATDMLEDMVDVWFLISSQTNISLFIGQSRNLMMSHVGVNGTKGLGMLGVNIMGESSLDSVRFTHNIRLSCIRGTISYPFNVTNSTILEQVGGGAYFLYHDYRNDSMNETSSRDNSLKILNSYFSYNADCSYAALTNVNYKYHIDKASRYAIGAGGGLSVIYAHSQYSLETTIKSTSFYKNDARYGGGAHVATFADTLYENSVLFQNCSFKKNGLKSVDTSSNIGQSRCFGGAGLAIFTDMIKPNSLHKPISNINNVTIKVTNTLFTDNAARIEGGGVYAYSSVNSLHRVNSAFLSEYFSVEWIFQECVFSHNKARFGAAASFFQRIFHGIDGIVILYFKSIVVKDNLVNDQILRVLNDDIASALSIKNVAVEFHGWSNFIDNKLTALYVVSTLIQANDNATLVFQDNSGMRGGAIYLEGTSPIFFARENVTFIFSGNEAAVEGGAIYFGSPIYSVGSLQPLDFFGCFVTTPPDLIGHNLFTSGSHLMFKNNAAPIGGVIFGSTLETCPWSEQVGAEKGMLISELYENYNSTFIFDEEPVGREKVSTYASRIDVTAPNQLVPGESANVLVEAYDQFNQEVFTVVTTTNSNRTSNITSMLGDSGFWFTSEGNVSLQVFGSQNQSVDISLITFTNVVGTDITIDLLSCPAGFEFDDLERSCVCFKEKEEDHHSSFVCDPASIMITTDSNNWVGMELYSVNSTDSIDLFVHNCHFSYCRPNTTFRPPNYDAQCAENSHRTGIMCGSCENGYSAILGGIDCRKCSNYYLFLFVVFAILGLVLFLIMAFLEFTIDKGWMDAILLYSNLITLYNFSNWPVFSNLRVLFVPAHLLSLELGFGVCFFDGMTALTRSAVQLIFPLYLYILMFIFKLISNRYSLSCYFSPAKTFVTLYVLCYVSLLNTCIEILAGRSIHTLGGVNSVRWLIDGNQLYFRGWHILLSIIAIGLLVLHLIPFTVSLFLPSLMYKYGKKVAPFYDALYGPYETKYRFWIGVRLVMRGLMSCMVKFVIVSTSLVVNLVIILTFLHIQSSIRPFKNKWLNILDSYLILNAALLYIGGLANIGTTSSLVVGSIIYGVIFLAISNGLGVTVFCYHISMRFPKIKERILKCYERISFRKKADKRKSLRVIWSRRSEVTTSSLPRIETNNTINRVEPTSSYRDSRYRDSIFENEDI